MPVYNYTTIPVYIYTIIQLYNYTCIQLYRSILLKHQVFATTKYLYIFSIMSKHSRSKKLRSFLNRGKFFTVNLWYYNTRKREGKPTKPEGNWYYDLQLRIHPLRLGAQHWDGRSVRLELHLGRWAHRWTPYRAHRRHHRRVGDLFWGLSCRGLNLCRWHGEELKSSSFFVGRDC